MELKNILIFQGISQSSPVTPGSQETWYFKWALFSPSTLFEFLLPKYHCCLGAFYFGLFFHMTTFNKHDAEHESWAESPPRLMSLYQDQLVHIAPAELQTIAGKKCERPGTLSCCPLLISCQQLPPVLNFGSPRRFQQVWAISTGVNSPVYPRDTVSKIDGLRQH